MITAQFEETLGCRLDVKQRL